MMTLNLLEAALFTQAPPIGSVNPTGEASYAGYRRVPLVADTTNLEGVDFPPSDQDDPAFVSHVVVLDGRGVVVGVEPLG